ncbi:MAG: hypothetical protein WC995_04905 [Lysobacteraceae bacterium]
MRFGIGFSQQQGGHFIDEFVDAGVATLGERLQSLYLSSGRRMVRALMIVSSSGIARV